MAGVPMPSPSVASRLRRGLVIPAHPLALTAARKLDERRQRALTRYYVAAGAGGIAVGVHTTQFAIREYGMLRPVLELAAEETRAAREPVVKIAGICGVTSDSNGGSARSIFARSGSTSALISARSFAIFSP